MNPLENITRYDEIHHFHSYYVSEKKDGEFVKFDDVELIVNDLLKKIEVLSKRHPTTEEALAQYHWLKENSKRNKNVE